MSYLTLRAANRVGCWTVALLFAGPSAAPAQEPAAQSIAGATTNPVDFGRDIAPLLRTRCLDCHGLQAQEAGLRLDSRERILAGGDNGPVVAEGASADSRLIQLVAGTSQEGLIMPPEGTPLTAEQVGRLRAWLDQGLPWPEEIVLDRTPAEIARSHWAFQPIVRPALPPVSDTAWGRSPIDAFVLARLEAKGIEPAPEADRRTLAGRVTLDLIGLPPTPREVAEFVNDARPDAYERMVDRLLASPHYGERWARPWLDLCHYADTDGYLTDQARPVAWRYRAWLVDALNCDLPFDQFTIEQLAGDLLPGATIEQRLATGFLRNTLSNREGGADLEEYRVEQIVDRTQMVGTTWLGLTVGCARCHDHKYDPISQQEFFQLYAFFNTADEVNIDAPLPGELEPYQAQQPEYERERAELLRPVETQVSEQQARWEKRLLEAADSPGLDQEWDRQWEVLGLIWGGQLGEGQLEGTEIVRLGIANRTQDQQDRLLDYFLKHGSLVDPARFADLKLGELSASLEGLKQQLPKLTRAPTMRESPRARPTHVHQRGDFRNPGAAVECGIPAVLPLAAPDAAQARPDRLALAKWLVAPENPLTARVTVNRIWQEFFGNGLTSTVEDFGTRGERPSHPQLLDWLASEFRDGGWSVKAMHRLIVTSATYRQSSRARPALAARDPRNTLLARQVGLRLTAEQVRDVTLAVSGLLDLRIGGPCVFPPQSESVAMEGFDSTWTPSEGSDRHRRGLYTYCQRLSPFAQQVTFDAPAPSRTCARRERSNTPLQALTLLNDAVFFEAAQALALRVLREQPGGVAERIEQACQICLSRPPSPVELERLTAYYQQQLEILRADPAAAAAMSPSRAEGLDPIEAAAWTGIASVLLNLHELITRE